MSFYVCEHCGEQHEETEGREMEALAESERLFGKLPKTETVRICHTCWLSLMKKAEAEGIAPSSWRAELDEEDLKILESL